MIRPTLEEARALCGDNKVIPLSLELFSDIKTPIEVLRCIKEKSNKCFLLESVEGGERWGRYSFLGFNPKLMVKCCNNTIEINDGIKRSTVNGCPNKILKQILADYKSAVIDYLPPFTGGFVGYISYDYIKYTEKTLKLNNINTDDFDDLNLMLFDKVIAFDYLKQKIIIIVNFKTDDFENNYVNAVVALKEIENLIKNTQSTTKFKGCVQSEFKQQFSEKEYCDRVKNIKEYIYSGDIFQAVLSNRIEADYSGDILPVYRTLRTISPSPYMFYLDMNDIQICGASPETLILLKNGRLTTFPIAGTCPRGNSDKEDNNLISELFKNEKELAEHNMLVDLGRNDLGKISKFNTVKIENYQKAVKFSHVIHITSELSGILKDGLDQIDVLSAMVPAGTLSGAPKIRACEVINELEKIKRGIYGGAVGYIDFKGNMDMCIAIRMAVVKNNKIYIQTGAGIVADSIPKNEFAECNCKAKAMIKAVMLSAVVE